MSGLLMVRALGGGNSHRDRLFLARPESALVIGLLFSMIFMAVRFTVIAMVWTVRLTIMLVALLVASIGAMSSKRHGNRIRV
jgi:type IV secretory pathway VirB3-like protein